MTAPVKMFSKDVLERRRIYLDYSCWLEEMETLSDFQCSVSPYTEGAPVSVDTSYPDETYKKLMLFVSGGVANTGYVLTMQVRTSAGQVKVDDLGLRVTP